MGKVSEDARQRYAIRSEVYKKKIDSMLQREKNMQAIIQKDETGGAYKKLTLAEECMNLSSLYLLIHNLSVAMLGVKNEDSINEARKTLYRCIIYLEEIVTDFLDVPYSDYASQLEQIQSFSESKRYQLMLKLGLSIRLVMDAFGDNSKWKWSFVELEGRFATVAKNIIDLKSATKDGLDPHSPDYDETIYHLRLVKQLLQQSSDRYREKYELSTNRIDDFRIAINYLCALRRIHVLLNERDEAEEIKKKADIWKEKMEKDHKKTEERKGR